MNIVVENVILTGESGEKIPHTVDVKDGERPDGIVYKGARYKRTSSKRYEFECRVAREPAAPKEPPKDPPKEPAEKAPAKAPEKSAAKPKAPATKRSRSKSAPKAAAKKA